MSRWLWLVAAVLGLAGLGLGGCGGGAAPAGASIADAQDGVTPEEVPTPEATPTPAAGDDDSARAEASAAGACKEVPRDLPLAEQCAMAGAEVHTFPNTCVGKCRAMENEGMMCGQAMTPGCRCPEGQCVDDRTGCCRDLAK